MSAHSPEFSSEAARSSRTTLHIPLLSIGYDPQMPFYQPNALLPGTLGHCPGMAHGSATHTDPQILFAVAS
jgi:hypothetical protein